MNNKLFYLSVMSIMCASMLLRLSLIDGETLHVLYGQLDQPSFVESFINNFYGWLQLQYQKSISYMGYSVSLILAMFLGRVGFVPLDIIIQRIQEQGETSKYPKLTIVVIVCKIAFTICLFSFVNSFVYLEPTDWNENRFDINTFFGFVMIPMGILQWFISSQALRIKSIGLLSIFVLSLVSIFYFTVTLTLFIIVSQLFGIFTSLVLFIQRHIEKGKCDAKIHQSQPAY